MPPELQSMIAGNLDAVSLCNLKLVCKGIDTWTKDPPKLSAGEWVQYHSMFETQARRRRKLQTLGCCVCKKLLEKGLFSDTAAHNSLKRRLCISCAIQKGSYNQRNFKVNGKEMFGCQGCQEAKPLGEKDTWVDMPHWYGESGGSLEIGTASVIECRGCRWCCNCWYIIKRYRAA
ncbi:hypothetical protein IMSHALPRED_004219 [Imshaugia aleurites]|uniref:F-box domain-containing protein n=1 Tax=Imshaugia aleurites TaxID=172621 RepID=A0A8H3F6P9_9LECA|nr:hypothetical protein IMSHALPRED_004219 [Imshaugia aleurites]